MVQSSHGYFILDVSALTKGLGNIKKWVEGSEYKITLFIPSYTIHELDYLKKGTSLTATNARESVRFIEKLVSSDDENGEDLTANTNIILETPDQAGPNWRTCVKYKTRAPKVSEFQSTRSNSSAIQYESEVMNNEGDQDASEDKSDPDAEKKAELPARLKYLIKPCIKKIKFDQEDWKLITEDATIKIWCQSYGIRCINISEAETELFHKKSNLSADSYPVVTETGGSRSRNRRRNKKSHAADPANQPNDDATAVGTTADGVVVEKFGSISYAPRGRGDLWIP